MPSLNVPEHLLVDFSTNILGVEIKCLLSKLIQKEDSFVDELFLNFQVGEVGEEL